METKSAVPRDRNAGILNPKYRDHFLFHAVGIQPFRSAVGGRDFSRGDFILEAVRIEAVQSAVGRFRLWVHEKCDWRATRPRQSDVVREVVSHPIHLPRAE